MISVWEVSEDSKNWKWIIKSHPTLRVPIGDCPEQGRKGASRRYRNLNYFIIFNHCSESLLEDEELDWSMVSIDKTPTWYLSESFSSYIMNPSSSLILTILSNKEGESVLNFFIKVFENFFLSYLTDLQTYSKLVLLIKFYVRAIVLSKLITAWCQPPGT